MADGGSIDGLRWIGSKIGDAGCLPQFLDDLDALCGRFGLTLHDVYEIEYLWRSNELVFTVGESDANGYALLNCGKQPGCEHTHDDPCETVSREVKVSASDLWANWPKWWIPFDGGLFIDHALTVAVPTA